MADAAYPALNNLLEEDYVFSRGYNALLKDVFRMREVQSSLDDFGIPEEKIRQMLGARSQELLDDALNEYSAYEQATKHFKQTLAEIRKEKQAEQPQIRMYKAGAFLAGCAIISIIADPILHIWFRSLPYLPTFIIMCIVLGIAVFALAGFRLTEPGLLLWSRDAAPVSAELTSARDRLLANLRKAYILPFVRTLINDARLDFLSHDFSVSKSPGLTDVYDTAYHVPTSMVKNLDKLLASVTGGSIGVAGSRGSGKSALIRRYCDPSHDPHYPTGDLRCMTAAPVDYVAREFVLYLFTIFCRAVIDRTDHRLQKDPYAGYISIWSRAASRTLRSLSIFLPTAFWWGLTFIALHNRGTIIHFFGKTHLSASALNVIIVAFLTLGFCTLLNEALSVRRSASNEARIEEAALRLRAIENLKRVRYLQTQTSGWSGTATLLAKIGGQYSRTGSWAEQPVTYPEIIDRFRDFAHDVASYIDAEGYRVFIGIDELDKIGAAESAERFLNEIKGIFGIPYTYFLVSVSDDALMSFEKRGLPLRDVFDSCFDEIIRAEPLTYKEARRLLYRRVIGLTEPFVALCYCISGGLARDLIRAARQVVRIGKDMSSDSEDNIEEASTGANARLAGISSALLSIEIQRKARAAISTIAGRTESAKAEELLHSLHELVVKPQTLEAITQSTIDDIVVGYSNDSPIVAALRTDIAGYLYFCMTLEEIFNDQLKDESLIRATGDAGHEGHFDILAEARAAFSIDTQLAWDTISRFRKAWRLPVQAPPKHKTSQRRRQHGAD